MAELLIPQRTQLPNIQNAGVKAPWQLANTSGQQRFGQAIGQVGENSFKRIIEIRAGNEYSEWLGTTKGAEQEFENYAKNNPYATAEQLESEQKKMFQTINKAAAGLTTNLAKNRVKQIINSSSRELEEYTKGRIESIIQKQQIEKMRADIDVAVASGDTESVKRIWEDNIKAGMFGDTEGQEKLGLRNDGTGKGKGYYQLDLKDGGVATEYSIGVELDGEETEIPLMVPTNTAKEREEIKDIIENEKEIPKHLVQKAVDHAKKRMAENKSPFHDTPDKSPLAASMGKDLFDANENQKKIAEENAIVVAQELAVNMADDLAKAGEPYPWRVTQKELLKPETVKLFSEQLGLPLDETKKILDIVNGFANQQAAMEKDFQATPKTERYLNERIRQVKLGAIPLEEVQAEIEDAYKPTEGEPIIGGDLYNELSEKLAADYDKAYSSALTEASKLAYRQLVPGSMTTFEQFMLGGSTSDVKAMSEEEAIQYWHLNQYNKELEDWWKKNGESKTLSDFMDHAEEQLYKYESRSMEDIRGLKAERIKTVMDRALSRTLPKNEKDITAEQYEVEAATITAADYIDSLLEAGRIETGERQFPTEMAESWREVVKKASNDDIYAFYKIVASGQRERIAMAYLMLFNQYGEKPTMPDTSALPEEVKKKASELKKQPVNILTKKVKE